MITLGIESSCDETAVALVEDASVLSNEVSSSVHLHAPYGGVIPEIASRYHVEYIYPATKKALEDASRTIEDVDLIAVTQGPGLPGSLLTGVAYAKALSFAGDIPIVGVNHLYAHILSCFLDRDKPGDVKSKFPFIGMVVSGGHTSTYVCASSNDFEVLGRTLDDAVGEAFDKVAKILDLGYPGGPIVEKRALAYKGKDVIDFPRALVKDGKNLDFSFSGIKTAVLYYWRDSAKTEEIKDIICFSFQEAVIDVIISKIKRVFAATGIKRFAVGGGVINNETLRKRICGLCRTEKVELFLPRKEFCSDNAAMIAALGEEIFNSEGPDTFSLNAKPGLYR